MSGAIVMQEHPVSYQTPKPSEELVQLAIDILLDWQGYKRALTYTVLASQVRTRSEGKLSLSLNEQMPALLNIIGNRCHEAGLPLLPSIVVAQTTGYPGNGFFTTFFPQLDNTTERLLAWAKELEAVYGADYRSLPTQASEEDEPSEQ
jgi:hypothetical protein